MLCGLLFAFLGTFLSAHFICWRFEKYLLVLAVEIQCKASTADDFNMQMVQQVSLDCDTCLHPETFMCKDGFSGVTQNPAVALPVIPSKDHPVSQQSVLTHDHAVTQLVSFSQDQVILPQPGMLWKYMLYISCLKLNGL